MKRRSMIEPIKYDLIEKPYPNITYNDINKELNVPGILDNSIDSTAAISPSKVAHNRRHSIATTKFGEAV